MGAALGPILSLITPTFNRSAMLREALASVTSLGNMSIEHWVIDGKSTDDTLAWLPNAPGIRYLSEADCGLYDALNKGLDRASGEIIGFLNSDDLLVPSPLPAIIVAFADPEVQVVTGGVEVVRGTETLRSQQAETDLRLDLKNVLRGAPNINARFFRRSFVERVGGFDLAFPIAADREWLLRAVMLKPVQRVIPGLVYRYREHDTSLTFNASDSNAVRYRAEHAAIAEKHLANHELNAATRRFLQSFHRRETSTLAARELRLGNYAGVKEWMGRGCTQSALWPLTFARRCAGMWFD
jgi:glycosyltransferase